MDAHGFDDVTRSFATSTSRRHALKLIAAAVFSGLAGLIGAGHSEAARGEACARRSDCDAGEVCLKPAPGKPKKCCPSASVCGTPGVAARCCRSSEVCAAVIGWEDTEAPCCCPSTSPIACFDGCCAPGRVCAQDPVTPTINGCCPAGSKSEMVNGKCCSATSVIATDSTGLRKCCPAGSRTQLVNGKCCKTSNVIATGGGVTKCCVGGSSTKLCGGNCCPKGNRCCNGDCCGEGSVCSETNTCKTCAVDESPCGRSTCCPNSQKCCKSTCCAPGITTCSGPDGTCGTA